MNNMNKERISPMLLNALYQDQDFTNDNAFYYKLPLFEAIQNIQGEKANLFFPYQENIQSLTCKNCGTKNKYNIGTICFLMNKEQINEVLQNRENVKAIDTFLENLQFSGYFRCHQCNEAGKWDFEKIFLLEILMQLVEGKDNPAIMRGKMGLYDGSSFRFSTDSETHLLQKLLHKQDDASLLWDKLGNVYFTGGRADLAVVAFEQSLKNNSENMDAYFSLANIYNQSNIDKKKAAEYYTHVLQLAGTNVVKDAMFVRDVLTETLWELHSLSQSMEDILFPTPPNASFSISENEYNLENESLPINKYESFYPLAEIWLGQNAKKIEAKNRTFFLSSEKNTSRLKKLAKAKKRKTKKR